MKGNLALLAAAATGVQVGAAMVASRFVVADVPPLTLALLRYSIGFCCLLPFFLETFMTPGLGVWSLPAIILIAVGLWLVTRGTTASPAIIDP